MAKKEDELAKYAMETEGQDSIQNPEPKEPASLSSINMGAVGRPEATEKLRQEAAEKLKQLNEKSVEQEHQERVAELQEYNRSGGRGFLPIKVEDLPTKGMFYPEGTRIFIKAATLGDIKHWSTTDETDLSSIDDGLNSIIESCCQVVFPEDTGKYANWRDLKEVDRLYIVLAIHDFTFPGGKNDLKVQIAETTDVVVKKDNIEFVKFSDKLMNFYNPDKRCFSFPVHAKCFEGGFMDIYIPSEGVTKWIKDYVTTRINRQEGYDKDFVTIAALLIPDHRGLNNDKYYALIDSTAEWTPYEWSLITKVRRIIETAVTPKLKYKDESGAEKESPLNFRGGIKAIFQPSLEIDL